jgi:hypothetical protein
MLSGTDLQLHQTLLQWLIVLQTWMPVPIFSTMNNGLPSTFVALLGEFQCNGLGRYVGLVGHHKHWTNSEKNALSKRLYFTTKSHQVIGSRNGRYRDTPFAQQLELAAKALDQKHVGLMLDMALKKIKAADTNIKKRAKKAHHPTKPNETTVQKNKINQFPHCCCCCCCCSWAIGVDGSSVDVSRWCDVDVGGRLSVVACRL